jgi:hypothetical protein
MDEMFREIGKPVLPGPSCLRHHHPRPRFWRR